LAGALPSDQAVKVLGKAAENIFAL